MPIRTLGQRPSHALRVHIVGKMGRTAKTSQQVPKSNNPPTVHSTQANPMDGFKPHIGMFAMGKSLFKRGRV